MFVSFKQNIPRPVLKVFIYNVSRHSDKESLLLLVGVKRPAPNCLKTTVVSVFLDVLKTLF